MSELPGIDWPEPPTAEPAEPFEPKLGDRVRFTGTVKKSGKHWRTVRYEDAPLPEFIGYEWAPGKNGVNRHSRDTGVVIGKRTYVSMEQDEGLWMADGVQKFVAYLVAYHLSRNPVIVRLDQMTPIIEGAD